MTEHQEKILYQVGSTVKAYIEAITELLKGKYAHLKDLVPTHLRKPGDVLIFCCEDGVIIRYETKHEDEKLTAIWASENLPELAPKISEGFIYCRTDKNFPSTIPTTRPEIVLRKTNPILNQTTKIATMEAYYEVVIEKPKSLPSPPSKPYCLLSAQNFFEFHLTGNFTPDNRDSTSQKDFLARTFVNLPVEWECIEIFPFFNLDHWQPEFAQVWAENDILGSVVKRQIKEHNLHTLDPNAAARKQYGNLLKKYKDLLDSNPEREEILQSFLKENPCLLSPTFIKIWPKLNLGDKETDFVLQDATGDYLIVEIERSTLSLFLSNGDTSGELKHAQNQILDWKRYLEDNLSTVQRELGLAGISTNPKSLIVIGRSNSLTDKNRRKLVTIENESPKTKILTYDDVFENTKAVVENLLGPLWVEEGNTEIYYFQNK